jgi:hypothetical protein
VIDKVNVKVKYYTDRTSVDKASYYNIYQANITK